MNKFNKYNETAKRLNTEAQNQYFVAMRETHNNLRDFRSRCRTYLNSKERKMDPRQLHLNDVTMFTPLQLTEMPSNNNIKNHITESPIISLNFSKRNMTSKQSLGRESEEAVEDHIRTIDKNQMISPIQKSQGSFRTNLRSSQ